MCLDLQVVLDKFIEVGRSGEVRSDGGVTVSGSAGSSSCQYTITAGVNAGHGATRITLKKPRCKFHYNLSNLKVAGLCYEIYKVKVEILILKLHVHTDDNIR